jgi:hypothetical protein
VIRIAAVAVAVALGVALAVPASAAPDPSRIFGVGVQMSFPYDELGDSYNTGFGVGALVDYPVNGLLDAVGHLGWNTFPHEGTEPAVEIWEISAGGRVMLGAFFMGGEVGWYDRGDEWSWVPSAGLRYNKWEASIRWRAVGRNAYTGLRFGWYF